MIVNNGISKWETKNINTDTSVTWLALNAQDTFDRLHKLLMSSSNVPQI